MSSVKRLQIARQGKEGLICRDNIRADIDVSFYVRVNPTNESVLEVAKLIGCAEASNPATMDQLFGAKFSEALKTVGKQMDFVELYEKRDDFRHRVIQTIGQDLNGYLLDDVAIEYLEQTRSRCSTRTTSSTPRASGRSPRSPPRTGSSPTS